MLTKKVVSHQVDVALTSGSGIEYVINGVLMNLGHKVHLSEFEYCEFIQDLRNKKRKLLCDQRIMLVGLNCCGNLSNNEKCSYNIL